MSLQKLASQIAKLEGKKSQARIGDIREILKIMTDKMGQEIGEDANAVVSAFLPEGTMAQGFVLSILSKAEKVKQKRHKREAKELEKAGKNE